MTTKDNTDTTMDVREFASRYPHPMASAIERVLSHSLKPKDKALQELHDALAWIEWWTPRNPAPPYAMITTDHVPYVEKCLTRLIQTSTGPKQRFWIHLMANRLQLLPQIKQDIEEMIEQEQ